MTNRSKISGSVTTPPGTTSPGKASLGKASFATLLGQVEKPSRYLGQEINSVHKDPADVILRAGLVFPDLYEVGMAHLGTRILYGLGNDLQGVQVERVFLRVRIFLRY